MAEELSMVASTLMRRAPRRVAGRMPPGCRTISVFVPLAIYHRVHAQASLSGMDMPDYLYCLLMEAKPLNKPSALAIQP